ncbi:MAG: YicC family protein [Bacteroidales bacterium]|nr:YicC family protein [Bacteroidales bacterium]
MKSMTGYAKRQISIGKQTVSIEIKTLNSKQLDLNVKLPSYFREKEIEIRSMLGRLERGKIDVLVTMEAIDSTAASLNTTLADDRIKKIESWASAASHPIDKKQIVEMVLSQSDVWANASNTQLDDAEGTLLLRGVEQALAEVERFRADEGAVLQHDIEKHVDAIEERMLRVPQYEAQRIETAKERICRYFAEFAINEMNKERFEQELIYYLEKLDITEEKVRLRKHIDFFRKTMMEEPICGKKLGFIAQEMGREINTTGSKANHVEIQRLVVEMKDELEKIKEQLGNIL